MAEQAAAAGDENGGWKLSRELVLFVFGEDIYHRTMDEARENPHYSPREVSAQRAQLTTYLDWTAEQLGLSEPNDVETLVTDSEDDDDTTQYYDPTYFPPSTRTNSLTATTSGSSTPEARDTRGASPQSSAVSLKRRRARYTAEGADQTPEPEGGERAAAKRSKRPRGLLLESDIHTVPLSHKKVGKSNFDNLLRDARRQYGSEKGGAKVINWYASIFAPNNVTRVLNLLKKTAEEPPLERPASSDVPDVISNVIRHVSSLISWNIASEFFHVHQMLYYADFAKYWTRLVELSRDPSSPESQYMISKAEKYSLTPRRQGKALVSAFLTYEVHDMTPARNPQKFTSLRERITYHRGVGEVALYVKRMWKPEMLVLLPPGTIKIFHGHIRSHMEVMRSITERIRRADDYWEVRRAVKHHVLPSIMTGTKPDINLMDAANPEADRDDPERGLVWLLSRGDSADTGSDKSSDTSDDEGSVLRDHESDDEGDDNPR